MSLIQMHHRACRIRMLTSECTIPTQRDSTINFFQIVPTGGVHNW
jgi:hypothetical protein